MSFFLFLVRKTTQVECVEHEQLMLEQLILVAFDARTEKLTLNRNVSTKTGEFCCEVKLLPGWLSNSKAKFWIRS